MTSSAANTLRIRFNSLRVSFFTERLHLLQKGKGLGGDDRGNGVQFFFFLKIKAKPKNRNNDVN